MAKPKKKAIESESLGNFFNKFFGGATDEFLESEAFKDKIANAYLKQNKIELPKGTFFNPEIMSFGGLDKSGKFVQSAGYDDAINAIKQNVTDKTKLIQDKGALTAGAGGDVIRNAIRSHPFKTAGIVGGGIANIAGLTDNDKVGGQIAGLAGGAFLPLVLGAASPSTYILGSLAGGTLGSLFDKLRARQEQDYNQNAYIQG